MNNKLKALMIPALLMMSVMMLVIASAPVGASPSTKSGTVYYGNYEEIFVGEWTTSTDLHFTVTSNATIDVYLMTTSETINYPTGSFNPLKAVEKTKNADFKVKSSTSDSYYLIIDNVDNSRSTDAVPTGDAAYNATYPNFLDTTTSTVNNIVNTCIIGAIAIVVIIVVVIIVIIYFFVIRKKPQPPVVQTPYGVQPVQSQQPVQYQQPGYPAQPQPYAPPPPSPYEPPPPPPPGQQYPPQ